MTKQGNYKNKTYNLRIPNEMQEKIKIIAKRENRKASQQYEIIIGTWLAQYESLHGVIKINEETEEQ